MIDTPKLETINDLTEAVERLTEAVERLGAAWKWTARTADESIARMKAASEDIPEPAA